MFVFARKAPDATATGQMLRMGALVGALAVAAFVLSPVADAKVRGMSPDIKTERVKISQGEIDKLDSETRALIEELRESSPVAVNYAQRADGVLIFPHVHDTSFLGIGESNAIGVLYTRDEAGKYKKADYYRVERHRVGFAEGQDGRSVVVMFMTAASLETFLSGDAEQEIETVDVNTGEIISGSPDAAVAGFVAHVDGKVEGIEVKDVILERVQIVN